MQKDKKDEQEFEGLSLKEFGAEIERLQRLAKTDTAIKKLGKGAEEISRKSESGS